MGRRARAGVALLVAGVVGLVIAASGVAAGGETPVVVPVGGLVANFNFAVVPKLLPKGGGPAELKVAIEEEEPRTGVPLGIAGATIGLDESIGFDFDGVPRCLYGVQVDAAEPNECDKAVVGKAEAKAFVDFPEGDPINLHSRGTVYKAGATKLVVKLPFEQPVSGELVFPVPIRTGLSGDQLTIKIPQITGGFGSLTSLELDLERTYVTAECRRGKLRASANVVLGDGSEESSEATRACTGG
jgi:hypothetical protein